MLLVGTENELPADRVMLAMNKASFTMYAAVLRDDEKKAGNVPPEKYPVAGFRPFVPLEEAWVSIAGRVGTTVYIVGLREVVDFFLQNKIALNGVLKIHC